MIINNNDRNPYIEDIYVYRIKDFFPVLSRMNSDIAQMKSDADIEDSLLQYCNYSIDCVNDGTMVDLLYSGFSQFCYESYQRVVWFDIYELDVENGETSQMLMIRCAPTFTEFCEKYRNYVKLLKSKENNLLDGVRNSSRYKQANADTPITQKFDANYTIDDYISWMTLNQGESTSDYGTVIQRLAEIRDEYQSLSKELKELLECNVIVYNSGIEGESI